MLPDRYSLENFKQAVSNPKLLLEEADRIRTRVRYIPNNLRFRYKHGTGIDVMAEDWDNLIILDACRYDAFAETNDIDGTLESRISRGSHSDIFMQENFAGRQLHDTIYVGGNPFVGHLGDEVFHEIRPIDVNKLKNCPTYGRQDETDILPEESYVDLPSDVVEETRRTHEQQPKKRLIAHFMQPHLPFIGPTGLQLYREVLRAYKDELEIQGSVKRWGALSLTLYRFVDDENVGITDTDLREAYVENLEIVLKYAAELVETLPGRTVITADHGELLGDHVFGYGKEYAHPRKLQTSELREVPWFIIEGSERRDVTADPPVESERMDAETTEAKLRALGYLD
jgi:hypothetical protein